MSALPDSTQDPPPERPRPRRRRRGSWGLRFTPGGVAFLMALNIIILGILAWPLVRVRLNMLAQVTSTTTLSPTTEDFTLTPSLTPSPSVPTETPRPTLTPVAPYPQGLDDAGSLLLRDTSVILALDEGANTHLFVYQPQSLPLTRLTTGPWDDITPALSPDGRRLAFASNRNGYWDLYLLDLPSGKTTRLTDSLEYDSSPSWSPDGLWLAYETYTPGTSGNLEIYIRSVNDEEEPVRLTDHPAADTDPTWSPLGRQVVFVSNRTGEPEIWLADLDKIGDERFDNLSQNSQGVESHPAWSPDGTALAWASNEGGFHNLYIYQVYADARPQYAGSGDDPVWSPDRSMLLTTLLAPNQTYLAAYTTGEQRVVMPPLKLPGAVEGLAWGPAGEEGLSESFSEAARVTATPQWAPILTAAPAGPGERRQVVILEDVSAPQAYLHDMVDESFVALRSSLANKIGWDFLSTLENAYVPLTAALDPGRGEDWLYTGRAFAFTPMPINAGWLVVVREDFGLQTYWRVYLRARFQDGSGGRPLPAAPWDFNARYTGDTQAYEQGGALMKTIPPGYWLDFTEFAAGFGWERQPALPLWAMSYPAARFNEFVSDSGLSWYEAMLELYPPEALVTPTPLVPPTRTLTPTPRWYQTPTPTTTPTPRPTLTPVTPSPTPEPSSTATPTPTETRIPTVTRTATPRPTSRPTRTPTPTPASTATVEASPPD